MDETLTRRLVGATVLLAFAFVVAALLPAPTTDRDSAAVVAYDLAAGTAAPERRAPEAAAQPAERTQPPGVRTLKVDETLRSAAPSWYVQVGSFESQANARGALQKLFNQGLPTSIQSVSVGKALWYRVRVGPFPDEAAAQRALAAVHGHGFRSATLVRPVSASGTMRN